jgi:hypothetical protein
MSTTRRRRIRAAHQEQLRTDRAHRRRNATAHAEPPSRLDDAPVRLLAWIAIAVLILIALLAVTA